MTHTDRLSQARLHRDVCIALLDAYVPHGQRAAFEQRVGISRRWYARLRDAYAWALPSETIAQRIARHLPAPEADCRAFLEHASAARAALVQSQQQSQQVAISTEQASAMLAQFRASVQHAQECVVPASAQQAWCQVYGQGQQMLAAIDPRRIPQAYLEICEQLAMAQYRLGNAAQGLYWAKCGHRCAEECAANAGTHAVEREHWVVRRFEIAHIEALGYDYLCLPEPAFALRSTAAAALPESAQLSGQVQCHGHRLATLPLTARFAVSEAEWLAQRTAQAVEKLGWSHKAALAPHALANVYLARGNGLNRRRAQQILTTIAASMEALAEHDLTARASWYTTLARLHWHTGDHAAWRQTIDTLLAQTRYLEGTWRHHALIIAYGDAVRPLIAHALGQQKLVTPAQARSQGYKV